MQKFLLANTILLFGLSLSLVYSILLFGASNTVDSVRILIGRAIAIVMPSEVYAHNTNFIDVAKDVTSFSVLGDFMISFPQQFSAEELKYPMMVPTNGVAGHKDFLFLPEIHPGIDIWSHSDGSGLRDEKHGYEVYSACSGVVAHYKEPNEEIEIICDRIPESFKHTLPSLNVKILYSHLGDGETGESFHKLRVGQRVQKGEFVGYQGNKSSFAPENRVVHLHFGVYDLASEKSPPPPLDPMYYIGVDTHKVGQIFNSGSN
jgi:hypothetical protein